MCLVVELPQLLPHSRICRPQATIVGALAIPKLLFHPPHDFQSLPRWPSPSCPQAHGQLQPDGPILPNQHLAAPLANILCGKVLINAESF